MIGLCFVQKLRTHTLTLAYYTGDTGLRGPVGEAGVPGAKGDQDGNIFKSVF